ncbi:MAG TPA: hypothetical protein VIW29_00165 [Polyangiaceae bacterium]
MRSIARASRSPLTRSVRALAFAVASAPLSLAIVACGAEPQPQPQPWSGFFHPPPKPGASIDTKQCSCRACDPDSCCQAEQTETAQAPPPECNTSYDFPESCGVVVQSCTPRCYSHVWRVKNQQSCETDRPLVCCR